MHAGIVFVATLIFHVPLSASLVVPELISQMVICRYLYRRILGLPPFQPGQNPSLFFRLSTPLGIPEITPEEK